MNDKALVFRFVKHMRCACRDDEFFSVRPLRFRNLFDR
jgi:hypothetical protein